MPPTRGRTWVLFGPLAARIDLSDLSDNQGFVIEGEGFRDYASQAAGVCDVNGDGFDDVAVGAPAVCTPDGCPGRVYVVFGKASGEAVRLSELEESESDAGYRIEGAGRELGWDVSSAGDVNLDVLADILMSAPFDGSFYVVFGKGTPTPVELATFHTNSQGLAGYRIAAKPADRNDYYAVANAGDVNGDGRPDAVVGVIEKVYGRGNAYVVFGKADPAPVDLSALALHGYRIRGPSSQSTAGYAVASAGDVNQDGLDDTLVTAPAINDAGDDPSYVVFGNRDTTTVELRRIDSWATGSRGRTSPRTSEKPHLATAT